MILSRLGQMAVVLGLLSFVLYGLMGLMPGDPIALAIAGDPRLGPEDAARLRALHGLDQPLLARYARWAAGLAQGEFGYSRLFAVPVAEVLWPALRGTLVLLGCALALAAAGGVLLGVLAATRPRAAPLVDGIALLGQAVPAFWLGMLLIILFAVQLGLLPAGGEAAEGPGLRFLVLPVATLAIANIAAYARHTAAAMQAALAEPWVRTARAKGASERRVVWRHVFPNAAVPVLTLAALDAGALVSGAVVTETVFARPGMGKLLYDAIMGNDYNLALLALLLVALVTMAASLAADLAQRALDPRLAA